MTYQATYSTNNGTRPVTPYESNNKRQLIRDIIAIVKGERHPGNDGTWQVWTADGAQCLAAGYIDRQGRNHYYNNH